jgi:NAD+ synthase
MKFDRHALDLDPEQESQRIESFLANSVRRTLRRNGVVIGISGGLDSSVVLALSVRAFGPKRVRAVIMPERESDPLSETLARTLDLLGIEVPERM